VTLIVAQLGSFACFGVAREWAASKCAGIRSTYFVPRHCA